MFNGFEWFILIKSHYGSQVVIWHRMLISTEGQDTIFFCLGWALLISSFMSLSRHSICTHNCSSHDDKPNIWNLLLSVGGEWMAEMAGSIQICHHSCTLSMSHVHPSFDWTWLELTVQCTICCYDVISFTPFWCFGHGLGVCQFRSVVFNTNNYYKYYENGY